MLIVNGKDENSLTIANHYVSLRSIPPSNVMVLDDVPGGLTVSLESFRERILRPILAEIDRRKLAPHIRVIAYSAGFPVSVKVPEHTTKLTDPSARQYQKPVASINSMTYFYRFVLADSHEYLGWGSNLYARGPFDRTLANPFGGEKGDAYDQAKALAAEGKYREAALAYEAMAGQYPTLAPLHMLAAEAWWNAGQRTQTIVQVGLAVRKGWQNRRYLTKDGPLSELFGDVDLSDPESSGAMADLLLSLQDVPTLMQGPVGFAADVGWASNGQAVRLTDGGVGYMLSCVLAVTHTRGSTIDQAVEYLSTSASADRTFPDGVVGYAKTNDVRTKTRFPAFANSITWLLARDRQIEIFSSRLPTKAEAYMGLTLGTPTFDTSNRAWRFPPGAIADNLTSTGAVFTSSSQTKVTELLHAGAAMSSGAVTEPYSITMKFPDPMIHAYYYEGVTAIEAFYLSIQSPYQMLIVGDPLTQPFARSPADTIEIELQPESTDDGKRQVRLTWRASPTVSDRSQPAQTLELYLQDRLMQRIKPVERINLQIPEETVGPLRCRAVLIGGDATQPRIGFEETFLLGPPEKLPQITAGETSAIGDLTVLLSCRGAEKVDLTHFGRVIASVDGDSGTVVLTPEQTGVGPVALQAFGRKGDQTLVGPVTILPR